LATGMQHVTIDITVPYAEARRDHTLRSEWQRQAGDAVTPVPALTLPRHARGPYTLRMRMTAMADLVLQDMDSDEIAGHCAWDDRVVTAFQMRGSSRLSVGRQMTTVRAGVVRAARESSWDWEVGAGTRVTILALPSAAVRFPKNQRSIAAAQDSPAARLLRAHLRNWTDLRDQLTPAASWAARNAAIELFHGLLSDRVVDDDEAALVRAATEWIDERLLDRGLDPRAVADHLFVSIRSLQRAFTSQEMSIMGYVREKRLDRARTDLRATSLTVSEIAARWHFSDGSHFIKAYKKRFGELPGRGR
jgi:AraC-like DNA-binding protein